jgi:methionyl-tRNA formyltransferase
LDVLTKIIPIGGTARAIPTLKTLLSRDDVEIPLIIVMRGYDEDEDSVNKLSHLAAIYGVNCIVVDGINSGLQELVIKLKASALIGIGVWRPLLPLEFLLTTRYGFLAVHGTPLPRYRGWAGLSWQIINGEKKIGLQAYKLAEGIDNGPFLSRKDGTLLSSEFELGAEMHLNDVFIEYEKHHIKLINQIVDLIILDNIIFIDQDIKLATFSCHRGPNDGEINWNDDSEKIYNFIRGQSPPYPCAFTYFKGSKVNIERARLIKNIKYEGVIPGKVVNRDKGSGIVSILSRDGIIEILEARSNGIKMQPFEIFSSLRDRCKSRVEAYIDQFHPYF